MHRLSNILRAGAILALAGCFGGTSNRVGVDTEDNLGDTFAGSKDLRTVAQNMTRSIVGLYQIQKATKPPRIALLRVDNRSNQIMDTRLFTTKIRTQLIKNAQGRVIFVDRSDISASAVVGERSAKRAGAVSANGSKMVSGVDYFLTGEIGSIDKARGGRRSTYTRFSFRLTDAESSDIIWEDEYEMKKVSQTGSWDM
ncbi:MAG: PBP1b-binding outer membrane lipoprotein LpoB [Myxococcota bacterium]|jgi:PBP1b-binding outer membrane lipoprotein LpoB